ESIPIRGGQSMCASKVDLELLHREIPRRSGGDLIRPSCLAEWTSREAPCKRAVTKVFREVSADLLERFFQRLLLLVLQLGDWLPESAINSSRLLLRRLRTRGVTPQFVQILEVA